MYCKYNLRDHINTLENYINMIEEYKGIDYYKYNIIINNLKKRIKTIKLFLNIPFREEKKLTLTERFRKNIRFV